MKGKNLRSAVLVLTLLFAAGCASSYDQPADPGPTVVAPLSTDLRETPDPDNVIHTLQVENGKIVASSRTEIPKEAFSFKEFDRRKDEKVPEPRPPEKIHPLLEKWIGSRAADSAEAVVVTFRDNLVVPRFPEPAIGESRDSPTNKRVQARNAEIIESLRAKRSEDYAGMGKELSRYGGEITEQFWLVRAVETKLPLQAIRELAQQEDVLYIEPVQTDDPPPQNGNANDDVADGRARINSDPYFALGQTLGFIGLLDTGIRNTHAQFNAPSHIDFLRDCVNGGANRRSPHPPADRLPCCRQCFDLECLRARARDVVHQHRNMDRADPGLQHRLAADGILGGGRTPAMIRSVVLALILITGASVCPTGAPDPKEWRIVYADEVWYRERNEAEREWRGTLRPRAVIEGPNARTAVRFDLMTDDGAFAVYAPTNALDDLVNESVVIRGKLVDLGEADRRVEIWPGAIARIQ